MGFSFLRFRFGSSGVVIVVPVHVRKRKPRLNPATDLAFFFAHFWRHCENVFIVLDFAPSSSMTTPSSTRQEVTQVLGDWD